MRMLDTYAQPRTDNSKTLVCTVSNMVMRKVMTLTAGDTGFVW